MTEEKPQPEDENKEEGVEPSSHIITQARTAAERLEKANTATLELIKRQEELAARNIIGGETVGKPQEEKIPEETPEDYAKRILQGK